MTVTLFICLYYNVNKSLFIHDFCLKVTQEEAGRLVPTYLLRNLFFKKKHMSLRFYFWIMHDMTSVTACGTSWGQLFNKRAAYVHVTGNTTHTWLRYGRDPPPLKKLSSHQNKIFHPSSLWEVEVGLIAHQFQQSMQLEVPRFCILLLFFFNKDSEYAHDLIEVWNKLYEKPLQFKVQTNQSKIIAKINSH